MENENNAESSAPPRPLIRRCVELPQELLLNAGIVPNRKWLLDMVPKHGLIAEVGVGLGGFSRFILQQCQPKIFYAIDTYDLHTLDQLWGKPTAEVFEGGTHRGLIEAKFSQEIKTGQVEILEGDSVVCLEKFPDASLDMVYVDAHHTYEAVKAELQVIRRKIKPKGIMILNDYTFLENVGSKAEYGVIQATHEFMIAEGWEMRFLALEGHMFCDVLITKLQPDGSSVPLRGYCSHSAHGSGLSGNLRRLGFFWKNRFRKNK